VVLASPRLAREAEDVLRAVRGLDAAIDVATMRGLNLLVDEQHESPATAAGTFLRGR
jgi:glycine betaine/choline ABC-type transport system substrate-binding protein